MSEVNGGGSYEPFVYNEQQRRWNDTTTWLAEVLDGKMRTPFEYTYHDGELYADDGGALMPVFVDSINKAKNLAAYEQRRRYLEMEEYECMIAMARDKLPNVMIVVSDFPPELMYSTTDVGGYNVSRKQTMLRVIYKTEDGKIKMFSQSLDMSDRAGLEAIYSSLGFKAQTGELLGQRMHLQVDQDEEKEFLIDQLTGIYDRSLQSQYGGVWTAGRRGSQVDTYEFVCSQKDLINAYLSTTDKFRAGEKEYNLAAAISTRLSNNQVPNLHSTESFIPVAAHALAIQEMQEAGDYARQTGQTFSGCGASIDGERESENDNSASSQMNKMGYGNKSTSGKEILVWKTGVCIIEECPTKPGKTKVAQCSICRGCQSLFDAGLNPEKIYANYSIKKDTDSPKLWNKMFEGIIDNSLDDMQTLGKEKEEEQLEQVNG